jgi:hypothetical protein
MGFANKCGRTSGRILDSAVRIVETSILCKFDSQEVIGTIFKHKTYALAFARSAISISLSSCSSVMDCSTDVLVSAKVRLLLTICEVFYDCQTRITRLPLPPFGSPHPLSAHFSDCVFVSRSRRNAILVSIRHIDLIICKYQKMDIWRWFPHF